MPSALPRGVPEGTPSISDERYFLVSRIGEGGMAGVYRAWDSRLRVWRAVKVLFPQYAKRKKLRRRFEHEAHTMARLEHGSLVRIYDVGDNARLPYLVMELVTGGTLQQWLIRNGAMPGHMAATITLQLTQGVAAAHAAGVVHRDIKPQNVLIDGTGRCKLTDFGIARVEDAELTKTGSTMGTIGYMAPEQRNDAKSVDHRADIYSIGATLWTLLAGEPARDMFTCHDDPSKLDCVPDPLKAVVLKCVAYRREDRYDDALALGAALRAVLKDLPGEPLDAGELIMDLTAEEPLTETPDFPEIRALLDGEDADAREPTSEEGMHAPPGQDRKSTPLPYFMPQSREDRQPSFSERQRSTDQFVPSYIDGDASMQTPRPQGRLAAMADAAQGPERDPSLAPTAIGHPTVPPTSRHSSEDDTVAPAPSVDPGERPPGGLSPAATVPLAITLAGATLFFVLLTLVFGVSGYQLYSAARAATDARAQLYTMLDEERGVVGLLSNLGAESGPLEETYMTWLQARGEPARAEAAVAFLDMVEREAASHISEEGTSTMNEADDVVRRLRASKTRYEADVRRWSLRSTSLTSRILIAVGAGSAPPR